MKDSLAYKRLIARGAPELPEGYFYRIRKAEVGIRIELRKNRFIGSTILGYNHIKYGEIRPSENLDFVVADRCAILYNANVDRIDGDATSAAVQRKINQLIGDHHGR